MRLLLLVTILAAAAGTAAAQAAPGPVAGAPELLAEIEAWRASYLPAVTPPDPLTAAFEPRLDAIKARAESARAPQALALPRRDFEKWQTELLRRKFAAARSAGLARGSFADYAGDQRRFAALSADLRLRLSQQRSVAALLAIQARSAPAAADPAGYFDGAAASGAPAAGPAVAAPAPLDPADPARYAKVRAILISQGASPKVVDLAIQEAIRQGADPLLVLSVVKQESGFNPRARSSVGARGLMQIMPDTGRGLGVRDSDRLYDIRTNLRAGIRFLKYLWGRFTDIDMSQLESMNPFGSHDVKAAVAAYNAGPGAVDKYDGVPPYRETQGYVKKVLGYYQQLQQYLGW